MPASPLIALLDDLAAVLAGLSTAAYTAESMPGVSGSIGAHVRHVLDHVAALVAADPATPLSYDARERGTAIERHPSAALRRVFDLREALAGWDASSADAPLRVSSVLVRGGPPLVTTSTRARELAFVVSHTVHHQAIIRLLLAAAGTRTPAHFGYAPSTPLQASA